MERMGENKLMIAVDKRSKITFEKIIKSTKSCGIRSVEVKDGETLCTLMRSAIDDIPTVIAITDMILENCKAYEEQGILTKRHIAGILYYIAYNFHPYPQARFITLLTRQTKDRTLLTQNPIYSWWLDQYVPFASICKDAFDWGQLNESYLQL